VRHCDVPARRYGRSVMSEDSVDDETRIREQI